MPEKEALNTGMWGTLLIVFYLARDTVYRWFTQMSSPLSRLAVVFFLSLCGLVFLSHYVISLKTLRKRIISSGAELIVATEVAPRGSVHRSSHSPVPYKPSEYELYRFNEAFATATQGQRNYALVEYLPDCTGLFPVGRGCGVFLLPAEPTQHKLPEVLTLHGYRLRAVTIPEREARLLRRLYRAGAVFIPYGSNSSLWQEGFMRRYVLQIKSPTPENVGRYEDMLRLMARLDHRRMTIISSAELLEQFATLEKTQYTVRVWVSCGISAIICLLLTCISSLEFRRSRYIYALIGSFGINRVMLYLSFIIENCLLVALGFAASLAVVWNLRHYITAVLYKSPDISLSLAELEDDIRTFALAFGICIIVSSIPIAVAAARPIGKELK